MTNQPRNPQAAPTPSSAERTPASAEETPATAPAERPPAPAPAERTLAPVPAEENPAPASAERASTPTPAERASTLTPAERASTLTPAERAPSATPPEGRGRGRGVLVVAWALSVLLVVALAAATVSVVALSRQSADSARRDQVMKAARQLALDFTTYGYENWDADAQRVLDGSTGQFKEEFAASSSAVKTQVVTNKASSKGDVKEAGVVSVDMDSAQVLVIVNAVVANTAEPDGVERRYRIKLDLVRDSDRWLTADLQVVG